MTQNHYMTGKVSAGLAYTDCGRAVKVSMQCKAFSVGWHLVPKAVNCRTCVKRHPTVAEQRPKVCRCVGRPGPLCPVHGDDPDRGPPA